MEQHPYFDLLLHDDLELAALLGSQVVERRTLHEWPLSCVQRLLLADGRQLVYKAQAGPTIEPEFYRAAHSPVLIPVEVLSRDERYTSLVIDYLDAPRLWDLHLAPDDLLRAGCALQEAVASLQGDLPVYLDISTWNAWLAEMGATIDGLRRLVASGEFSRVSAEQVDTIESLVLSEPLQALIEGPCGLIHGDLAGDNVFVLPDSYRIIDWQRPLRGPLGIDLALLADSFNLDPRAWVSMQQAQVMYLLRIHWLTACTLRWFPDGKKTYDAAIAQIVSEKLT